MWGPELNIAVESKATLESKADLHLALSRLSSAMGFTGKTIRGFSKESESLRQNKKLYPKAGGFRLYQAKSQRA